MVGFLQVGLWRMVGFHNARTKPEHARLDRQNPSDVNIGSKERTQKTEIQTNTKLPTVISTSGGPSWKTKLDLKSGMLNLTVQKARQKHDLGNYSDQSTIILLGQWSARCPPNTKSISMARSGFRKINPSILVMTRMHTLPPSILSYNHN